MLAVQLRSNKDLTWLSFQPFNKFYKLLILVNHFLLEKARVIPLLLVESWPIQLTNQKLEKWHQAKLLQGGKRKEIGNKMENHTEWKREYLM